uniref:RNA exonuclease 4 n=1 Tax=Arcella intermedia TaxID=1963864 RepID=A0A6B2L9E0_9EUKA
MDLLTDILALDCEMVGMYPRDISALGRVCIVNAKGDLIYDSHCLPEGRIQNYRTKYSGIRPSDLRGAPKFSVVQSIVLEIVKGRIIVGHDLKNDFSALEMTHPPHLTRDTARFPPLMRTPTCPFRLKILTQHILGLEIQSASRHGHCPAEDARAALLIYEHFKETWEKMLLTGEAMVEGDLEEPADEDEEEEEAPPQKVIQNGFVEREEERSVIVTSKGKKEDVRKIVVIEEKDDARVVTLKEVAKVENVPKKEAAWPRKKPKQLTATPNLDYNVATNTRANRRRNTYSASKTKFK